MKSMAGVTARFGLSIVMAGAVMGLAALPLRSTSARELLYIEAEQSKDIHIVDAHTLEKIGRIEIGRLEQRLDRLLILTPRRHGHPAGPDRP